jgi:hypothetical protein
MWQLAGRRACRGEVLAWLEAIGAADQVPEHSLALPELPADTLSRLLTSDPMWSKPRLDREYTDWRCVCLMPEACCATSSGFERPVVRGAWMGTAAMGVLMHTPSSVPAAPAAHDPATVEASARMGVLRWQWGRQP